MNTKKTVISTGAVIAIAAAIFAGANANKKEAMPPAEIMPVTESTAPVDGTVATSDYKDGTYTAVGSYRSPAGPETITVTTTVKNDVITGVSVVPHATHQTSIRLQGLFIGGYQQYVVGKDIDSVKLGAVSGSSLTPIGFNDALAKIKAKAKA